MRDLAIKVWVSPKRCYYSRSLKGGIQFINPLFISTCINNAFCPNNFPPKSISAEICQDYIVTASNIVLFWTINTRLFLKKKGLSLRSRTFLNLSMCSSEWSKIYSTVAAATKCPFSLCAPNCGHHHYEQRSNLGFLPGFLSLNLVYSITLRYRWSIWSVLPQFWTDLLNVSSITSSAGVKFYGLA